MSRLLRLAVITLVVSACGGPILANPPAPRPSIPAPTASPVIPADPLPVVLPRDDGPHDRLTEWWYYTGHLVGDGEAPAGQRFGFEFVIFRAERGAFPTTWASHLAITDENADRFHYGQRLEIGETVDGSPRDATGTPTGFDLTLVGVDPTDPSTIGRPPWTMRGSAGRDRLRAALSPAEAAVTGVSGLGLDLQLVSRKAPALHDRDGWIDFGPAGGSYYYSRTAMDAEGTLTIGDATYRVGGDAWFDHQWGDF
ncbi:MAG TPA: carotenoid 1,2-hydratase, partial [Actinomycetota bacterium]|nr:carotenoid 1,2-hydratase [Actinomycetota bacterium]